MCETSWRSFVAPCCGTWILNDSQTTVIELFSLWTCNQTESLSSFSRWDRDIRGLLVFVHYWCGPQDGSTKSYSTCMIDFRIQTSAPCLRVKATFFFMSRDLCCALTIGALRVVTGNPKNGIFRWNSAKWIPPQKQASQLTPLTKHVFLVWMLTLGLWLGIFLLSCFRVPPQNGTTALLFRIRMAEVQLTLPPHCDTRKQPLTWQS